MRTRQTTVNCLFVFLTLLYSAALFAKDPPKPNIVFVITDDQGWGDVGYNGHPHIQTPVLDDMAVTGLRFDRFYAPSGVCAPSRAAVLTGRSNVRVGISQPSLKRWHLARHEWTVAEMLREQGYTTAHYGKWHLGTLRTERDSPHNLFPDEAGFDDYFSSENILYTYDPYQALPADKPEDHMYVDNGRFIPLEEGRKNPNLRRDDATILADKTIAFIHKQARTGKPFFVALWFHHVHGPLSDNPKLIELYSDVSPKEATYYSNITSVDREVGRVRQTLRDLSIADNTILWYTSDNGPHGATIGAERLKTVSVNGQPFRYGDRGSPGPYKGGKWTVWEAGIRVPSVLEWPAVVKEPMRTRVPCGSIDFMPTMMDILNVEAPKDCVYDGISLLPLFRGEMTERSQPMPFLIAQQRAWVQGPYKIVTQVRSKVFDQLYHIENDPFETNNLISTKPEKFQALLQAYKAWEKEAIADAQDCPRSWDKGALETP